MNSQLFLTLYHTPSPIHIFSLRTPPPSLQPLSFFSCYTFLRKLLEGEETRLSTGITYPIPGSMSNTQSYNYQSRVYTSSTKSTKKEREDDEDKPSGGSDNSAFKKGEKHDSGDAEIVTSKN